MQPAPALPDPSSCLCTEGLAWCSGGPAEPEGGQAPGAPGPAPRHLWGTSLPTARWEKQKQTGFLQLNLFPGHTILCWGLCPQYFRGEKPFLNRMTAMANEEVFFPKPPS